MSETDHTPLIITQSDDGRVVTIDGYKFATDLLRQITASPLGERFRIVSREDGVITVSVERDPLEYAAPDMLAALQNICANAELGPDMGEAWHGTVDIYKVPIDDIETARAAIAKATGGGQ